MEPSGRWTSIYTVCLAPHTTIIDRYQSKLHEHLNNHPTKRPRRRRRGDSIIKLCPRRRKQTNGQCTHPYTDPIAQIPTTSLRLNIVSMPGRRN